MRHLVVAAAAVAAGVWAAPAFANPSEIDTAPSAREVQASVDAYLAPTKPDATLVGGPGQAGYDSGFWIRGGTFLLKINLTIQTRWEGFSWKDEPAASAAGDLSGFSLPRTTLKFSGDATCSMHYYAELEFGHPGFAPNNFTNMFAGIPNLNRSATVGSLYSGTPEAREAWIEYDPAPQAAVRMGLIKTAATRQLMTPPEMQQFVDVSMASGFIGQMMPGYTDRNRDYGVALHGALGCDGEWSYLLTVTNGDGPVRRNIHDSASHDNFAYSARINWDIKGHPGYEEGALRQTECGWVAAVGAWAHYYDDYAERPHFTVADRLTWGADLALGYGGFSFTGAYNSSTWDKNTTSGKLFDATSWFVQAGYLFPNTAWEIAARYGSYTLDPSLAGLVTREATEWSAVLNYYIDGHANKLQLDVTGITVPSNKINSFSDQYAGYNSSGTSDAMMVRFQWQLAL